MTNGTVEKPEVQLTEPEPGTVLTELKPTFMSKGPIIMDEVTIVGKGTIEALQIIEYDNGESSIYI